MIDKLFNPKVSIIILNYNAGELLLNCLESVFRTAYDNIEVIVVDNASKDQSHKKCKEKFDKIKLIENKQNLGYCEGNNVGIREASGEFIVILNPDTTVDHNWIIELISAYRKHGEGLYQPKIISLYEENILQSTGNMIHLFGFGFARDKGIPDIHQQKEIERIGYASGTCLFTSQQVIKKIGLFDSFLFLYHDDLDLGWRAAQLGIRSYYVPLATIYHAESYSLKWSSKKFFWLERNRRYCLLTHYSRNTYKKMLPYLRQTELMVWIFYISKGFLGAKIRAELDIIKNKQYIVEKYQELEAKKIIPDTELIKSFPDEIFIPKNVSDGFGSRIFNSLLVILSQKAKNKILSK
ncbi:glycosyltransferase family 2 protein [Candidatus Nitrosotenuis cloacae]|uniref:glycosyltransferase family 2 protein n=1 Tax=Candidatus Nitrosotenuis cloacae TaxID=1603555 RepID=UPI001F178ECD|nr:glycosyltransferase family 2 protein [Candidatus Nitrosotenuis cloacae]